MSVSVIQQHIRKAAGHEDAAGRHEDRYAQQMISAGAEMYEAFTLALKAAPDYQGRQIDDKAIARIYASTKPRPWWDAELKAAELVSASGKVDRERATRLIQWHIDPAAAQSRRAQRAIKELARRKTLDKQRTTAARGPRMSHKSEAREAGHMANVKVTSEATGSARLFSESATPPEAPVHVSLDDLLRELNRMSSAARRVPEERRDTVREILVVTAREIERYVP